MYNVQKFTDRHGRLHLYFRKAGMPRVRLQSPLPAVWEGSPLKAEVDAILASLSPKPTPGTLAGALRAYETESADYRALAQSTRMELYLPIMKEMNAELGGLPIAAFTPGFILKLRDLWATSGHRACNVRLQVLKNVLWPHLVAEGKGDPFAMIPQAKRPAGKAEPHPLWPPAVIEAAIRGAIAARKFGLARAIALARYTGARRGDLCAMPKTARAKGRIRFLSGKRKVLVDAPEDPLLTEWLARIPATQPDQPRQGRKKKAADAANVQPLPARTIVFNLKNEPYTEDGLGQELAKLMAALHKDGLVDHTRYDLHGLRHTRGIELALAGCTDAQGAAALGHLSPNSFAQYRRQADRIRLSDDASDNVARLRERTPNGDLSNDVSNSCQTATASAAASGEKP